MNTSIRRATPDSEAIASSEDERPWPAAPSFGSLPHKENSVPGFGGGIWSTQKRGSFKMEKTAQRNAAREARLGAPGQPRSGLRNDSTPSPSASEGSAALPFQIPLQPAPKAGRSLSHSQGQREYPPVTGAHSTQPDHAPALPLGLLAEEADTESESELGGGLTQTTSHPPIGTLHRTATFPATYDSYYGAPNGRDHGDASIGAQGASRGDRRFESAFANLTLAPEQPSRRSQWQTHLGWDDVPNVNESRRHSLADIPTRRGSLVAASEHRYTGGGQFWPDSRGYDWESSTHPYNDNQYTDNAAHIDFASRVPAATSDPNMLTRQFAALRRDVENLPQSYRVSQITLPDNERGIPDIHPTHNMAPKRGQQYNAKEGVRRQLFIVSFKCSRVEVFYLLEGTGLVVQEGDIVIVEADRGQDLGTVQHANVTTDEAKNYKRRYWEEHYKWLMMFSKNNDKASVNPNAQVYSGETGRTAGNHPGAPPHKMQGTPKELNDSLKPKAIKRLANQHEIRLLAEKEGNEAKAKRTCQTKVNALHLEMEILDAEWQWDFQKLIFYYYADHYINFKDLVTELYRIYKTRIWMSAINPASYSQHAMGSPPAGIGPGALTGADRVAYFQNLAAGIDPDPHGAVPPYSVGYNTYTPNYPAIPGVVNSFPNPTSIPYNPMPANTNEPQEMQGSTPYGSGNATPSAGMPGPMATGYPQYGGFGGYGGYDSYNSAFGYGIGGYGQFTPNNADLSGSTMVNTPPMLGSGMMNTPSFSGPGMMNAPLTPAGAIPIPRRARGGAAPAYDPPHIPGPRTFSHPYGPSPAEEPRKSRFAIPRPTENTPTQMPAATGGRGSPQKSRLGAFSGDPAKKGLMDHFLDSLQDQDDARADDMSRER